MNSKARVINAFLIMHAYLFYITNNYENSGGLFKIFSVKLKNLKWIHQQNHRRNN